MSFPVSRSAGIAVLSGESGSGKTTVCRQLVEAARRQKLDCAGLLSPARFTGPNKTGIDLLDLRSGERRPLAEKDTRPAEVRTRAFRFYADVLAWGAAVLEASTPCDLLVVDELGPLELIRGQGWANALNVLQAGQYGLAVAVVRPSLVTEFGRRLSGLPQYIFRLPDTPPAEITGAILAMLTRSVKISTDTLPE